MLPRFEIVARRRPVDLVAPLARRVDEWYDGGPTEAAYPLGWPAPYVAACADLASGAGPGLLSLDLSGGGVRLTGWYDPARGGTGLEVVTGSGSTTHRSRRYGRATEPVGRVGLVLTGTHLTVLTHGAGGWTARGRVDLHDRVDTRDQAWLTTLRAGHRGSVHPRRFTAGGFGQLGLRDVRVVTAEDGAPYRPDGRVWLTATSAGPGFFDTAHTSVWHLDPQQLTLTHSADLFFRRPGRDGVFGDNATHLVRRSGGWLVATSTWGDFDPRREGVSVEVTLAEATADLLHGCHVLDTRPLSLPTTGLRSVGVWDPHLVRADGQWYVGFVNGRRFFSFHPVLASGPTLDSLTLRAAAPERIATEGTTLFRHDGKLWVLASDGRDGRRGQRRRYPVFDLDLTEVDALQAPYLSNIPWPTVVRDGDHWLLVAFDGTPCGGPLLGYGSHGDVVLARA